MYDATAKATFHYRVKNLKLKKKFYLVLELLHAIQPVFPNLIGIFRIWFCLFRDDTVLTFELVIN